MNNPGILEGSNHAILCQKMTPNAQNGNKGPSPIDTYLEILGAY